MNYKEKKPVNCPFPQNIFFPYFQRRKIFHNCVSLYLLELYSQYSWCLSNKWKIFFSITKEKGLFMKGIFLNTCHLIWIQIWNFLRHCLFCTMLWHCAHFLHSAMTQNLNYFSVSDAFLYIDMFRLLPFL